jgi:DNA-binding MarR family transcriptional regulator
LIDEIVTTAEQVAAARHVDGERVARTDPRWRLLRAIERSNYCLSISDLGRLLHVPRQRAHEIVVGAARSGEVEVLPNAHDRRILQVFLTARGRSTLSTARQRRSEWTGALLNGLGRRELRETIDILRTIRHRLLRDERETRGLRL